MTNTKSQLTRRRDEDFIRQLRRITAHYAANRSIVSRETIIEEALASRPMQYYISYTTALTNLAIMRRHGYTHKNTAGHTTRDMWIEIQARVNEFRRKNPGIPFTDAIQRVLADQRPARFYIPIHKARELFRIHIAARRLYTPRKQSS